MIYFWRLAFREFRSEIFDRNGPSPPRPPAPGRGVNVIAAGPAVTGPMAQLTTNTAAAAAI